MVPTCTSLYPQLWASPSVAKGALSSRGCWGGRLTLGTAWFAESRARLGAVWVWNLGCARSCFVAAGLRRLPLRCTIFPLRVCLAWPRVRKPTCVVPQFLCPCLGSCRVARAVFKSRSDDKYTTSEHSLVGGILLRVASDCLLPEPMPVAQCAHCIVALCFAITHSFTSPSLVRHSMFRHEARHRARMFVVPTAGLVSASQFRTSGACVSLIVLRAHRLASCRRHA